MRRILLTLLLALMIHGCGNKGPLYLPAEGEEPAAKRQGSR